MHKPWTPEEHARFAAAMNTPTPREQELEAQNKALWELVDSLIPSLCAVKDLSNLDHMARARSLALGMLDSIAAIQKAKEAK